MERIESHTSCEWTEELIAYLYGEMSQIEARIFEKHTAECASCRAELAAFGMVRQAIGEWRQEALESYAPGALNLTTTARAVAEESAPRRSALAALKAFLDLSPLWLRAGAAAASVAISALVVFSFAHMELRWDTSGIALRAGAGRCDDRRTS